jgi:ribosome maturation factor RimP
LDLEKVREVLVPYLEQNNFKLYDLSFVYESGMHILRVLVSKKEGITIDELADINHYLSDELDKIDDSDLEYMLEVSSPGAEMPLRNQEEILDNVGKYVNINTGDKVFEGQLLSFENDVVVVRVNLKGRFKNFEIPYENIKKIRLAVKF